MITSEEALKRQSASQYKDRYFFDLDYNEELDFEYVVGDRSLLTLNSSNSKSSF